MYKILENYKKFTKAEKYNYIIKLMQIMSNKFARYIYYEKHKLWELAVNGKIIQWISNNTPKILYHS